MANIFVGYYSVRRRRATVAFDLDRIDGTLALPLLRLENVSVRGDEAMIKLRVSEDHDIEVSFPAPGGVIEAAQLELAADVLAHLRVIDNEVQRGSAKQWVGSPYPSSYHEGNLAYFTLTGPDEVVLRYWVIGCNSEWDERFVRTAAGWVRVADAEPLYGLPRQEGAP